MRQDLVGADVAQRLGQQRAVPPCVTLRRWLIEKRQQARFGPAIVGARLAGTRGVGKRTEPVLREPLPPLGNARRARAQLSGDILNRDAFVRKQNDLGSLDEALLGGSLAGPTAKRGFFFGRKAHLGRRPAHAPVCALTVI